MRPQVIFTELRARDPHMLRLVEIMDRTSGGTAKVKFKVSFFRWLRYQILMIEDYAYTWTDFKGNLDLPLPPGAQWGDIGKKQNPKMVIMFFMFFMRYHRHIAGVLGHFSQLLHRVAHTIMCYHEHHLIVDYIMYY